MKKTLLIILVCFAVYGFLKSPLFLSVKSAIVTERSVTERSVTEASNSDRFLAQAFENNLSDVQVGGSGQVVKILPDDTQGSQHQQFIVKLKSGQTILIAHNIDIAPRINSLKAGDHINFYGEYEWSAKGGVVHWTHHDPGGRHENGWLNHGGKMYE